MTSPFTFSTFTPAQGPAIEPDAGVWVTASAGTGKTYVLVARVLRLLLDGASPDSILCVTYTRAATAEMATRIFTRLAAFIRASDADLAQELRRLGVKPVPDAALLAHARTLFARTLEAPGGLKIQTIHSFCQSLLGRFPLEADLAPGFGTLSDRTADGLARLAMDSDIALAYQQRDLGFLADFARLAVDLDAAKLHSQLAGLAHALSQVPGAPVHTPAAISARVLRALGLPLDATADTVLARHTQHLGLETPHLRDIADAWARGGVQISARAQHISRWLENPVPDNVASLYKAFLTAKFELRKASTLTDKQATRFDPDTGEKAVLSADAVLALKADLDVLEMAHSCAAILRVAWRIADTVNASKQNLGLVSFDDLIARTVALLASGSGDWVRYKLDAKINHVLVDEAQDTNAAQWTILKALTEEFFSGASAREANRSIFAVGDFKQAIYRFQGSDPATFLAARDYFAAQSAAAEKIFIPLPLATSFRSAPAIIDFVNQAMAALPPAALGPGADIDTHTTDRAGAGGEIIVWPCVETGGTDDDDDADDDDADVSDSARELNAVRPPSPERVTAQRIAQQIRAWTAPGSPARLRGRAIVPGDIMVLVQQRRGFAKALVADLKALGVAVAGIDRLKLVDQIAVQDLLACARFVLLPDDDLTLACLLKSPLLGWSDDALDRLARPRSVGQSLWSALRDSTDAVAQAAIDWLLALLAAADLAPPYDFFANLYYGGGRAKLFARLGSEIDDPVSLLLDLALQFEAEHVPSLQAFVAWMEADTDDLKREAETSRNEVRIMTVHGAKGLQARIVILADAHAPPSDRQDILWAGADAQAMPIWMARKISGISAIDAARAEASAKAYEDYWRLFYVAITRAEDQLCVAGWVPARAKALPIPSWHAVADTAVRALGGENVTDGHWGTLLRYHQSSTQHPEPVAPSPPAAPQHRPLHGAAIPSWATSMAPFEPVPPRPLSPSDIGPSDIGPSDIGPGEIGDPTDDAGDAPETGAAAAAARARGQAIHRLLELLPALPAPQRAAAAGRWAATWARTCGGTADQGHAVADQACSVLAAHAPLFGPEGLAEVPITATLGTRVLSGRIDRLVVLDDAVWIIDYKTSTRVPTTPEAVAPAVLRQIAAYRAAVQEIYPAHRLHCALLWTHVPALMVLPDAVLDAVRDAAWQPVLTGP